MPPLTTKELTALEDLLGGEQLLVKKYQAYANESEDQKIKVKCNMIAEKHQQHFNTLMGCLK